MSDLKHLLLECQVIFFQSLLRKPKIEIQQQSHKAV